MKKILFLITIALGGLAVASLFWNTFYKASISESIIVSQAVTAEDCNRNGVCEKDYGENILNCPSDCPPTTFSGAGDRAIYNNSPSIWGLRVFDITEISAQVEWNTDLDSVCELRWGLTQDYENGGVSEVEALKTHSASLENLAEFTKYHYKISCRSNEVAAETTDKDFFTLRGRDLTSPDNVSNLSAWYVQDENKIVLRWKNPESDFLGVNVLRNDRYFPRDQSDGVPLCDGNIQICEDLRVEKGKKYYYSVFAYDRARNYSSGAVVSATTDGFVDTKKEPISQPINQQIFLPKDFILTQNGSRLIQDSGGRFVAKTKQKIVVSTDYEKFIKAAKFATISVDIDMRSQAYLFRSNKDNTEYISNLYFNEPDIYSYAINVTKIDNSTEEIKGKLLLEGNSAANKEDLGKVVYDEVFPDFILLLVLSLTIAIVIRKLQKMKKKTDKREK